MQDDCSGEGRNGVVRDSERTAEISEEAVRALERAARGQGRNSGGRRASGPRTAEPETDRNLREGIVASARSRTEEETGQAESHRRTDRSVCHVWYGEAYPKGVNVQRE